MGLLLCVYATPPPASRGVCGSPSVQREGGTDVLAPQAQAMQQPGSWPAPAIRRQLQTARGEDGALGPEQMWAPEEMKDWPPWAQGEVHDQRWTSAP